MSSEAPDPGRPRSTLRVLFVDDSRDDVELERMALEQGGFEVVAERVDTEPALRDALRRGRWDVVLADHRMPQLDSSRAFRIVQESDPDLPFVLISGTIPENVAVASMRAGVQDYLSKDNLQRLAVVVGRELREARE